ncbi:hypothetical protein GCM10023238_14990 [Streptomyces heliomycini]
MELTVHVLLPSGSGPLRVLVTTRNLAGGFLDEETPEVWDAADRLGGTSPANWPGRLYSRRRKSAPPAFVRAGPGQRGWTGRGGGGENTSPTPPTAPRPVQCARPIPIIPHPTHRRPEHPLPRPPPHSPAPSWSAEAVTSI